MGGKGNSYLDQGKAIKEVERGFDILKQLQGIFQFESRNLELAEPLFTEALQALHHALSIMNNMSGVIESGIIVEKKLEIPVLESSVLLDGSLIGGVVSFDQYSAQTRRIDGARGKRKMVEVNSWMNKTSMPHDDGHQWRKYGDKKITGSNFTRSYFRCTHREKQGCQAKKIVQLEPTSDRHDRRHAPSFKVTYINNHTCNNLYIATKCASASSSSSGLPPVASAPRSLMGEQDIGVNNRVPDSAMPPQPLDQGSGFPEANNGLGTADSEWDMDYFLVDNLDQELNFPDYNIL